MESKTKNKKTREQIARMVERAFDGLTLDAAPESVTELKGGWFNAAYDVRLSDGRSVILKIAPPVGADVLTYEKNIMTTEVETMRLVAQNPAIPVPHIYSFDTARDTCDSDYFFMEKVAGDNLEHVYSALAESVRVEVDHQIGVIVRAINGFTGATFGYDGNPDLRGTTWREAFIKIVNSVLGDGQRKSADLGFPVEAIRSTVLRHAASLDEVVVPQLVHWDAWNLNLFVRDGRVTGIVDFERALWGDPLMEAQFRALAFGGMTETLKAYGKTTFTRDEDVRCHLYTLHLALVMKVECYYRNYDTDEVNTLGSQLMAPALQWLQDH
ncbi:MAG: aminoglycoside phosphotransferase family protein [Chloroflexi bacterium]|nr:aminoglycoside phosphotransferase family protein [Chloroflexota bacterium]